MRNIDVDEDSKFSADIVSRYTRDYTVIIPLKDGKGNTLHLELSLLDIAVARIRIKEPGSKRFKLPYFSLIEEPVTVKWVFFEWYVICNIFIHFHRM